MSLSSFIKDSNAKEQYEILEAISREVNFLDCQSIYYTRIHSLENWLIIGGTTPFYFAFHEMYDDKKNVHNQDWRDKIVFSPEQDDFFLPSKERKAKSRKVNILAPLIKHSIKRGVAWSVMFAINVVCTKLAVDTNLNWVIDKSKLFA